MIILTINGKKVSCPGCYEELNTRTYQRIISEWDVDEPDIAKRDPFKLFSILTGTDCLMQRTPENEVTIWNAVNWFFTQPFKFSAKLPKVLQIGEKQISVPENAGLLSFGQNINLRQVIDKARYMEECISMAVAICLQPLYDNTKYDFDRAKELEKLILDMPIYLTHPVGFYLLQTVRKDGWKPTRGLQQRKGNLIRRLKGMWPQWPRFKSSGSLTTYPS